MERMTSGSYFPPPVKEVEINKKDGGKRKLRHTNHNRQDSARGSKSAS